MPHKLTPNFGEAQYEVVKKTGNELILEGQGRVIGRHVSHAKKVPPPQTTEEETPSTPETANNSVGASPLRPVSSSRDQPDIPSSEESALHVLDVPNTKPAVKKKVVEPLHLKREKGVWRPASGMTNSSEGCYASRL